MSAESVALWNRGKVSSAADMRSRAGQPIHPGSRKAAVAVRYPHAPFRQPLERTVEDVDRRLGHVSDGGAQTVGVRVHTVGEAHDLHARRGDAHQNEVAAGGASREEGRQARIPERAGVVLVLDHFAVSADGYVREGVPVLDRVRHRVPFEEFAHLARPSTRADPHRRVVIYA